jgi:hypothetical protein
MFDLIIKDSRQTQYILETVDELYVAISKLHFKIYTINHDHVQKFPFHLFKNLKVLTLNTSNIRFFPSTIKQLSSIEKLEINSNDVMEFPKHITELTTLKEVKFFQNNIRFIPDSICNLSDLEYLSFIHCNLVEFPTSILELTNLTELYLCGNRNFVIPENFHLLSNLQRLGLHTNNMTEVPISLFELKNLEYLDLSSNKIKTISTSIEKLTKLEEFIICGNPEMHNCLFLNLPRLERLVIDRHINDIILHENVENNIDISNGIFNYNHIGNIRYINAFERTNLLRRMKREKMEIDNVSIPDKMKCSICHSILLCPRVNQQGNIYCLECIEQHYRIHTTDPLTNLVCSTKELFPIQIIENEVNEFIDTIIIE